MAEFIFEHSPDAYFVIENDTVIDCNPSMERLMATERGSLIGASPRRQLSPERQPCGRLSGEKAAEFLHGKDHEIVRFEWTHQRFDGTPLPVQVTLMPTKLGGKALQICFWQDMRETVALRTAQEAVRRERELAQQTQTHAVQMLAQALGGLAAGDLCVAVGDEFPQDYDQIKQDLNHAAAALKTAIGTVAASVDGIDMSANEILSASRDLAERSERTAAGLEETSSALNQITVAVASTAERTRRALAVARQARKEAQRNEAVVQETTSAVQGIERSSKEIELIVTVIDEIAFQTNLLALNAGVEAARAGDSGRGFAVVAQEVRALAQRSASAAKDIKLLISTSSAQVARGVKLVGETGSALQAFNSHIAEIIQIVSEIADSASQQSSGLHDVNRTIGQMDQATQQNAAMCEQSTAASHLLATEARKVSGLLAEFYLGEDQPYRPPSRERPRENSYRPSGNFRTRAQAQAA